GAFDVGGGGGHGGSFLRQMDAPIVAEPPSTNQVAVRGTMMPHMRRLATRLAVLALLAGGLATGGQWIPAARGQDAPGGDGPRWRASGPGGGTVSALAVDPTNHGVAFAGTSPLLLSGGAGHVYETLNR